MFIACFRMRKFWLISLAYAIPTGGLGIWCSVLNINLSPVGVSQVILLNIITKLSESGVLCDNITEFGVAEDHLSP